MKRFFFVFMLMVLSNAVYAGFLNMINCPDCNNQVSVRAAFCPKCGCAKEAIQQHLKAVEALSRLSDQEASRLVGQPMFGQQGRLLWQREALKVKDIIDNPDQALSGYTISQKKAALEARKQVMLILDLGFTLDQIITMRHDLINTMLGKTLNR